ncbi:hypothetical protein [Streptomyces sp. NPDC005970]|uniref:hypothetical protein n=1 Tax=Streptomyces sp. NPDC005970 TaxID=3156723 RepID=UPI00340EC7F5
MAFRAVHAQWGAIFAHLPDLGSGQSGKPCGRPGRPRRYVSDECRHPMHGRLRGASKTSRTGLRFFAHAPDAPACALGLESAAHHLLKLELTAAAPDAGAHAELEVPGPGSAWRADVLATDPTWAWKTAPGAQLASPSPTPTSPPAPRGRGPTAPPALAQHRPLHTAHRRGLASGVEYATFSDWPWCSIPPGRYSERRLTIGLGRW